MITLESIDFKSFIAKETNGNTGSFNGAFSYQRWR
ncbi:MAG: hypothetical protein ACI936_004190 [Paraglaciecola sp.]|jgi:hypothetical protein